jgi:hypothetical protein
MSNRLYRKLGVEPGQTGNVASPYRASSVERCGRERRKPWTPPPRPPSDSCGRNGFHVSRYEKKFAFLPRSFLREALKSDAHIQHTKA